MKKILPAIAIFCSTFANAGNQTAANFYDSLLIPKNRNINWTWDNFKKLPPFIEELKGFQKFQGYYVLSRSLDTKANLTVDIYGTKDYPEFLIIQSGGWGITDEQKLVKPKLNDFNKLASNCNFGKVEISDGNDRGSKWIDYQNIYVTKPNNNYKPLYIVDSKGGATVITGVFNEGINTSTLITYNLNNLPTYIEKFAWNKNNQGKKLKCVIH